jgi:hypothetical protein
VPYCGLEDIRARFTSNDDETGCTCDDGDKVILSKLPMMGILRDIFANALRRIF